MYQAKTKDCEESHEDSSSLSECKSVYLHEWLRCIQRKKGVQIRSAEQEQDSGSKAKHSCSNCASQNATSCDDTTIRSIKRKIRSIIARYLAFFVSSAMCPEASNPIIVPAVNKLQED